MKKQTTKSFTKETKYKNNETQMMQYNMQKICEAHTELMANRSQI